VPRVCLLRHFVVTDFRALCIFRPAAAVSVDNGFRKPGWWKFLAEMTELTSAKRLQIVQRKE
jgi:hypothetical protein